MNEFQFKNPNLRISSARSIMSANVSSFPAVILPAVQSSSSFESSDSASDAGKATRATKSKMSTADDLLIGRLGRRIRRTWRVKNEGTDLYVWFSAMRVVLFCCRCLLVIRVPY